MPRSSVASKYLLAAFLAPSLLLAQTHRDVQPSDSQILGKVQTVFHDEHAFVGSSILPSVSHGVVTLTGNVRSEAEKTLASAELANIAGIKTVLNNLEIHDNTFHPPVVVKAPAGPTGPQTITLPAGTALAVRLTNEIDTRTAHPNDTFHATTAVPVLQNGLVLLPAGTPVTGRIVNAKPGNLLNSAQLSVELMSLRLTNPRGPEEAAVITQQIVTKPGSRNIDLKAEQLLQFRTASPLQVPVMLVDGKQVLPQPTQ